MAVVKLGVRGGRGRGANVFFSEPGNGVTER